MGTVTTEVTSREREVLIEICQGESNKALARTLHLSPHTVTLHVMSLCAKFGAENRTHLAILALLSGVPSREFTEYLVNHSIEGRNCAKNDPDNARTL